MECKIMPLKGIIEEISLKSETTTSCCIYLVMLLVIMMECNIMFLKQYTEVKRLEYETATSCCIQVVKYATCYNNALQDHAEKISI